MTKGTLPSSLLLHGPRGVGKQRLALWLGQLLLCQANDDAEMPCGRCTACRFALELGHPDLRWFFPRPRLSGADASSDAPGGVGLGVPRLDLRVQGDRSGGGGLVGILGGGS